MRRVRLRVRLRGRRQVSRPARPPREVAERLSAALAPIRSRLLRRVGIAHRGPVLDIGAGWGIVTEELARRSRGPVVALDRDPDAVRALGARGVLGEARDLPFAAGSFDLVFCQQVLMWQPALDVVLGEVCRVLSPGGVLVALEPDFGAMMEDPPEISMAGVWRAALTRAGADPSVGRKLPGAIARAGLDVRVDLISGPAPADFDRFELLDGLPLTDAERVEVGAARSAQAGRPARECFVHLPFVCVTGSVSAR